DDLPANDAWPTRLSALGVAVERQRLPGYVEMMLSAQDAIVPQAMVGAVAEWLGKRATQPLLRAAAGGAAPRARADLSDISEQVAFVDAAQRLFGILSEPKAPPPVRRGLLLLNAGSVHRVGPNRLYVT